MAMGDIPLNVDEVRRRQKEERKATQQQQRRVPSRQPPASASKRPLPASRAVVDPEDEDDEVCITGHASAPASPTKEASPPDHAASDSYHQPAQAERAAPPFSLIGRQADADSAWDAAGTGRPVRPDATKRAVSVPGLVRIAHKRNT